MEEGRHGGNEMRIEDDYRSQSLTRESVVMDYVSRSRFEEIAEKEVQEAKDWRQREVEY